MRRNGVFSAAALLASILLSIASVRADDILSAAENYFFRPGDTTRIGIEVEMGDLSPRQAAEVVRRQLGGKIEIRHETIKTDIRGYDASGKALYNERVLEEFVVRNTSIGRVVLKPEMNQIDDVAEGKPVQQIVELVTDPIHFNDVSDLNQSLTALKAAGATGTTETTAVATQVNVEMFGGNRERVRAQEIVDLLRAYLRPESRTEVVRRLQIPDIRKPYLSSYSPGFMKRLLDPAYHPSERQLYDDFLYRQSLELLGNKKAWSAPIEVVRKHLLAHSNPIVPSVVKQNALRISSLLMWMFPDDPLTTVIHESGWARPAPIVEFREWNTNFDAIGPTKQALGLKSASAEYGYFNEREVVNAVKNARVGCVLQHLAP